MCSGGVRQPVLSQPGQARRHYMGRRDPQAAAVQAMHLDVCLKFSYEDEQALPGAISGILGHALNVGVCTPRLHPLCQSIAPAKHRESRPTLPPSHVLQSNPVYHNIRTSSSAA